MKAADKSSEKNRNFELLISKLSENEILDLHAMSTVRGGNAEGEGDGGEVVITRPKF